MKNELTDRQKELLDLIKEHQKTYNTVPTLVELASKMKITVAGVSQKIEALTRKKVIERKNIYIIKN